MFTLMELRTRKGSELLRGPQYTPQSVNINVVSDQTQQAPYDPPRPGDHVSRVGTHPVALTIAIEPFLAVARWPNLPTINPSRKLSPAMPRSSWRNEPGRKNIARRGDQSYGSLSQLYPMIDTEVVV